MLTNIKGICAAAAVAAVTATAAQADNHTVLIMDGGFFPAVSYVQPGDNIIFTNNSSGPLRLAGSDSSWSSEAIPVDATYLLNITNSTNHSFVGINQDSGSAGAEGETDDEYINLDDVVMEGAMSFEAAPLDG